MKTDLAEDTGQRFQYTGKRADGTEMVWGWSDEYHPGMVKSIILHPDFVVAEVFDRQKASDA